MTAIAVLSGVAGFRIICRLYPSLAVERRFGSLVGALRFSTTTNNTTDPRSDDVRDER